MTRSRGWSRKLWLAAAGIVVGLLATELMLRLAGFSYVTFERPDMVRGVALAPGARGWQTLEGRAFVTINSRGYRDRERGAIKPDGVYRIAILGDSFVESRQVALDDTCWSRLEGLLSGSPAFGGKTVEVLPFGVSSYGTGQQLLTLRRDVFDFAPDLVVLAFFAGNDVSDNSKALSQTGRTVPFFSLRGDELVLDASFQESAAFKDRHTWKARAFYATQQRSRLVQLLYKARGDLGERLRGEDDEAPFAESGLPNAVYQEPADPEWQQAWLVTERLIRQIFDEVRSRGATFRVMTLSTPIQAHPDAAVRRRFAERLRVDDLFYPDRRINALGDRLGFAVLNLGPEFQKQADDTGVHFYGFKNTELGWGHWNEQGHQLAATVIARWLSSR